MRQPWAVIVSILLIGLAVILQVTGINRMELFGARPDLPIVVAFCIASFSRPAGGAAAGFASGLFLGALSGATLAHYVFSQTIVGFLLGKTSYEERDTRAGVLIIVLSSLACGLILMFLAPRRDITGSIQATILAALFNGVVAVPVYALVRRLFRPQVV
ncbi:rod shape-determining protein MreD [Kamptonema cortianum]|nr:rod shape-determining protein MreD [Geitlerinema splendidum]MDK3156987.1 rod shape-determining protein MreD [Kamptonema cortianum]